MASESEEKITETLEDDKLPCPMAFNIAKELKLLSSKLGKPAMIWKLKSAIANSVALNN